MKADFDIALDEYNRMVQLKNDLIYVLEKSSEFSDDVGEKVGHNRFAFVGCEQNFDDAMHSEFNRVLKELCAYDSSFNMDMTLPKSKAHQDWIECQKYSSKIYDDKLSAPTVIGKSASSYGMRTPLNPASTNGYENKGVA